MIQKLFCKLFCVKTMLEDVLVNEKYEKPRNNIKNRKKRID